jgi:hypothetical protein
MEGLRALPSRVDALPAALQTGVDELPAALQAFRV